MEAQIRITIVILHLSLASSHTHAKLSKQQTHLAFYRGLVFSFVLAYGEHSGGKCIGYTMLCNLIAHHQLKVTR